MTALIAPPTAAAATKSLRATCAAPLRTQASTTAAIRVRLKPGATVKSDKVVSGRTWRTSCGGRSTSGSQWYRITAIGGTSVSKLYGVRYVYGIKGRFAATSGPWFGRPDPWAGKPFGSFPNAPAGQMWITGNQHGRVISKLTFRNRPPGQNVIVLYGVSNLRIDLIDFDTVAEGIYIWNSHDVEIGRIRARNIFGPYTRTAFHSGNLIQASNSRRLHIHDIKMDQPDTVPSGLPSGISASNYGTEDIISLGGDPGAWGGDSWAKPFLVERFMIDGGAWRSHSGTGIFVGDGASGKYVWIRNGVLHNPGQVGIATGEEGPYRFQNIRIKATRGNEAIQLRSSRAEFGGMKVQWPGRAINTHGHSYTTIAPNDWNASFVVRIAL